MVSNSDSYIPPELLHDRSLLSQQTSTSLFISELTDMEEPYLAFDMSLDEDTAFIESHRTETSTSLMQISDGESGSGTSEGKEAERVNPMKLVSKCNKQKPKKAYLRIQLIRGFKKSIRQISKRKWAKLGVFGLDKRKSEHKLMWKDYYQVYKTYQRGLADAELMSDTKEKSFSNAYCQRFFQPEAVRKAYFHFTELVFRTDLTPEEACKKLKVRCCQSENHTDACTQVWTEMKRFSTFGMFEDLNLQPWNGYQWSDLEDLKPEQYLSLDSPF